MYLNYAAAFTTFAIYMKYTATDAIATWISISGNHSLKYSINERWIFSFSQSHAATRFADAQIRVPLPPRQAPNASDHHKNVASIPIQA